MNSRVARVRVLLVEGDEFQRAAMHELCRMCKYEVTAVSTGEEAIQLTGGGGEGSSSLPFDLVLCDVRLSGMSGHDVLVQLRLSFGENISVVMVGSSDQTDAVEGCILEGGVLETGQLG